MISRTRDRLRVDVHDASPTLPRIRCPGPMAEEGRGLLMAKTLADALGWRPTARGKIVYFELVVWPDGHPCRASLAAAEGSTPPGRRASFPCDRQ